MVPGGLPSITTSQRAFWMSLVLLQARDISREEAMFWIIEPIRDYTRRTS
jgi:hypothetical protein